MLKQKLVMALGLLATTAALADIPPPPGGPRFPHDPGFSGGPRFRPTLVMNIEGSDALDLFDRIRGRDFRGPNKSTMRVMTSKNNTFRIFCERWRRSDNQHAAHCEINQSPDGRALPEFMPPQPPRQG